MIRRVLRWTVPVTGDLTMIGAGPVVHVAIRADMLSPGVPSHAVEVWTDEATPDDWPRTQVPMRPVIVVGTGHPIRDGAAQHVGSAIDPDVRLVWHLFYASEGTL